MSFDKNNQNPNQNPNQKPIQQPGKTTDRPMQDDRNKQNDRSKTQQGGLHEKGKQK